MIQAFIFDLDGTLVKTEKLKAQSYARAAIELRPELEQAQVIEGFKQVVGKPRRQVAQFLLEKFDLGEAAQARMEEFAVDTAWQAYVQVRLNYYHDMIRDPEILLENRWGHTNKLLAQARERNCTIALATMSRCQQANRVIDALGLEDLFALVATRDDVENGKPDPEIYELVAAELQLEPAYCLVLEDSTSGVEAALAANMNVVAVATPFTKQALFDSGLIPESHIAEGADDMPAVVDHVISHIN